MSEKNEFTLSEDFFERHTLSRNTTAGHISYFQMWTLYESDFDNWVNESVISSYDERRRKNFLEERTVIESLTTPDEIIRYMRKPIEISNRNYL